MTDPRSTSYSGSIDYLENLYRTPHLPSSSVGLRRVEFLMGRLGNPHRAFRSVHIAGSTGKGSTTSMMAQILRSAGHHTGAFRSPHLMSYTERINVGPSDISEVDWLRACALVLPVADAMRRNAIPGYELGRPSLFEVLFALACTHFALERVEWAVMETGLGGRLDATNLLQSDVAAVTNVSLEHTKILGRTAREIATEKAAIIKRESASVTAASDADALGIIEKRAESVESPLLVVGRDIQVHRTGRSENAQMVTLTYGVDKVSARLPLAGPHQLLNAGVAFGVAVALRKRGVHLPLAAVRDGLESVAIPGRMEIFPGFPEVILDGAQSTAGVAALAAALAELPPAPTTLVFAAMDDKNIEEMAKIIAPHVGHVVATEVPGTDRTSSKRRIEDAFNHEEVHVIIASSPDSALAEARSLTPGSGRIVVAGSLYLVGAVRAELEAVQA